MESGYWVDMNVIFCSFKLITYDHCFPNYLALLFANIFKLLLHLLIVLGIIQLWTVGSFYLLSVVCGKYPSTVIHILNIFLNYDTIYKP